jgi:hypothetical protein
MKAFESKTISLLSLHLLVWPVQGNAELWTYSERPVTSCLSSLLLLANRKKKGSPEYIASKESGVRGETSALHRLHVSR